MALGGYNPFPLKLGGGKPLTRVFEESLRASHPSVFTFEEDSRNDIRVFCTARVMAATYNAYERYRSNLVPGTSYELLLSWAERLGVIVRDADTPGEIRTACDAAYQVNKRGATEGAIYDTCKDQLGDMLDSVEYNRGTDFDNPPSDTYWDENPGAVPWSSSRALITINATKPASMSQTDFDFIVDVRLYRLLNTLLPIWVSWKVIQS